MRAEKGRTLYEKVWDAHVVLEEPERPAVLYVDLHLLHEVTSPQAFAMLRERGRPVRRPRQSLATMDHSTPTRLDALVALPEQDPDAFAQLSTLTRNCETHGIELHPVGSSYHGIIHVMAPELGRVQPGMTIVCGDSHTSTHGAFGALAFGIGSSEVGHVLATQCLLQRRSRPFEVRLEGRPGEGVSAKDIILAFLARVGTGGGTGHVLEYRGSAISSLDMEARMTLCNMSIEAGARASMIAPDDTTFEYLAGRPAAPVGHAWDRALQRWRRLFSDDSAEFAQSFHLDLSVLEPMTTYGTHPGASIGISEPIPEPGQSGDRVADEQALSYMGLSPGQRLLGHPIDAVFIGSCTNSRLSDLRDAACILGGRKVKSGLRVLVVPGSQKVKAEAEAEGLDRVFRDAGAEWREPGCSMCIAMNGDRLEPGEYAVSTSNRNFEGRQGPGSRTFLASPLTAAACALTGQISDPRSFTHRGSP